MEEIRRRLVELAREGRIYQRRGNQTLPADTTSTDTPPDGNTTSTDQSTPSGAKTNTTGQSTSPGGNSTNIGRNTQLTVTTLRNPPIKQLRKWNSHFDGKHIHVYTFLERFSELSMAYSITEEQLLPCLPELPRREALLWYMNERESWET